MTRQLPVLSKVEGQSTTEHTENTEKAMTSRARQTRALFRVRGVGDFDINAENHLSEPRLRMCSPETRGVFVGLFSLILGEGMNPLVGTTDEIGQAQRADPGAVGRAIAELAARGVIEARQVDGKHEISLPAWSVERHSDKRRRSRRTRATQHVTSGVDVSTFQDGCITTKAASEGQIHVEIAKRRDLSSGAKIIWAMLVAHSGPEGCFVTQERLARLCGKTEPTIGRHIRKLKDAGLITSIRRGRSGVSHYTLNKEFT